MFLLILLLIPVSVIAFCALYWFIHLPHFAFPKNAYVVENKTLLEKILGQLPNIIKEAGGSPQQRWMKEALKEDKYTITYDFSASTRAVMILHPEDVAHVLTGKAANALIKHKDYERLTEMIGEGLVSIRDEAYHTEQRRFISPAFQSRAINSIANYIIPHHSSDLDKNLQKISESGKPAQLGSVFDSYTLNVIVEAAFKKLEVKGVNIGKVFTKVMSVVGLSLVDLLPRSIGRMIPTKRRSIVREGRAQLDIATEEMSEIARKQQEAGEVKEGTETFLDYIVREKSIGREQRAAHLLTQLAAGGETGARALQFLAIHLSQHPEVQERLYEDLCEITSLHVQPSVDDLKDCSYLECVIKETLRLTPSAPLVGREATIDIDLPFSKVHIPKGARVVLPIFCWHRNPKFWGDDALEFRPERFEEEKTKEMLKQYPMSWAPFLAGKRDCIGKQFAWAELLIGCACLVRSFKFSWPEGKSKEVALKWAITMRPKEDPEINVVARES